MGNTRLQYSIPSPGAKNLLGSHLSIHQGNGHSLSTPGLRDERVNQQLGRICCLAACRGEEHAEERDHSYQSDGM